MANLFEARGHQNLATFPTSSKLAVIRVILNTKGASASQSSRENYLEREYGILPVLIYSDSISMRLFIPHSPFKAGLCTLRPGCMAESLSNTSKRTNVTTVMPPSFQFRNSQVFKRKGFTSSSHFLLRFHCCHPCQVRLSNKDLCTPVEIPASLLLPQQLTGSGELICGGEF